MKVFDATRVTISDELYACYYSIIDVAIIQVVPLLEKFLQVVVVTPVPKVKLLKLSELHGTLQLADIDDSFSAVCQGFLGEGISGEALLVFNDSCFNDISSLMKYDGCIDDAVEIELIMDIAGMLIGTCIKGIGDQLDISFSQGHPFILSQHSKVSDLINISGRWNQTLAIEINFVIKDHNINCDLLLLFTEDTINTLNDKVSSLRG